MLPHSHLPQLLWFQLAWLWVNSVLWILIFMSSVCSSHTKWMCAMSEFSWPCFWLVYILGKADILPKVSQIISSLWLVYGFLHFFCYTLYKSGPYQNRILLERWKFVTLLLISVSGSFVTSLVSRSFAPKHRIELNLFCYPLQMTPGQASSAVPCWGLLESIIVLIYPRGAAHSKCCSWDWRISAEGAEGRWVVKGRERS